MNDDIENGETLHGRVKWFDPGKGFGFVVAETGGADILLYANVLRNFGQNSVADGSEITVEVQETPRGRQALCVLDITAPAVPIQSGLSDLAEFDPEELAAAPLEPARVKWFDKAKGFGFANVFGLEEDIFVHIEVLRRSGFADLQPGEAVGLRAVQGKRGRMAMEILSWETALARNED
ncbi:cold-shock protein [Roseisalinus antarcticus]|uniref:Cold shock-like protein CspA n=1 Tax=Roseisalinus antarcticus TaxID=254357 RepID=A0A1Y5TDY5_9RHOB|nr:cold shock domain-containing protein [Roseisalinus antarcticus]SLN59791.1 Cold shock-like protein CspA [Roseisalinus antarcticus]